jgi:hypothetical protein
MISRIPSDVVEVIASVQPFRAPTPEIFEKHSLRILRELSNTDKHRNLNPAPLSLEFNAPSDTRPEFIDGAFQI